MIVQRRITDLQNVYPGAAAKAGSAARPAGLPADTGRGAPASAQAGVEVSTTVAGTAADSNGFDTAKVERISASIKAGTFKVDPGAIADGLIADAKAFFAHGLT